MRFLILTLALALLAGWSLYATDITAISYEYGDVTNAIAQAGSGGTVRLPLSGGSAYWTNTLVITNGLSRLIGPGTNIATIYDSIDRSTMSGTLGSTKAEALIYWGTLLGETNELTGIDFEPGNNNGNRGSGYFSAAIQLWGSSEAVRIHNCRFGGLLNRGVYIFGSVCGVMDHSDSYYSGNNQFIASQQVNLFGGQNGDGSWENPVDWGGPKAFYVEDCFVHPNSNRTVGTFDGFGGGRLVIRYNTITNSYGTVHGTESSQRLRGHRSIEIYMNKISIDNTFTPSAIELRSGTSVIFSNTITGPFTSAVRLSCYREFAPYTPWGTADGTKLWDSSTGTVFDHGALSGGGVDSATDNTKSWTVNQWAHYSFRITNQFVLSSGTTGTATVAGAGWTVNQWAGYEIEQISTGAKSRITSNTATVLTLNNAFYQITFAPGDIVLLSIADEIASNTGTVLTLFSQGGDFSNYTFANGQDYEIRHVDATLDSPGRGISQPISGSPPNNQNLSQAFEPVYQWGNTLNGANVTTFSIPAGSIVNGRDYTNNVAKPGYTPYTYPHPLVGAAPCIINATTLNIGTLRMAP